MKATYWYFTFQINDEETGFFKKDHAVAASEDNNFPLDLVLMASKEEFGDSAQVLIMSQVKISLADYKRYCKEIGVE